MGRGKGEIGARLRHAARRRRRRRPGDRGGREGGEGAGEEESRRHCEKERIMR